MLKVVVLPAPLGPSRPTISRADTSMETPLTTRRRRYAFTSFSVTSKLPLTAAPPEAQVAEFPESGLVSEFICRRLQITCPARCQIWQRPSAGRTPDTAGLREASVFSNHK